jgi:hypothetical protein
MKFLCKKQNFSAHCVLATAIAYILSGISLSLAEPFPSGIYPRASSPSLPSELFEIGKDLAIEFRPASQYHKISTFDHLVKYRGFVGAHYNSSTNLLSHWIFPENPTELQHRPVFLAMAADMSPENFELNLGIRFGYIVDANILGRSKATVYCEKPHIFADGKRVATSYGFNGTMPVRQNLKKNVSIEPYLTTVLPVQAHLISAAKVIDFSTCGTTNPWLPKKLIRLRPREHQQFKQLVSYLATITKNQHLQDAVVGKPPPIKW